MFAGTCAAAAGGGAAGGGATAGGGAAPGGGAGAPSPITFVLVFFQFSVPVSIALLSR